MDELKPCPFCGRPAYAFGQGYVRCGVCRFTLTKKEWQARPAEDDKDAQIAELEREATGYASKLAQANATLHLLEGLANDWISGYADNDVNQGEDPEEVTYYEAGKEMLRTLKRSEVANG